MLYKIKNIRKCFAVADLIGEVGTEAFKIRGNTALADALGDRRSFGLQLAVLVKIVKRGSLRVGKPDFHTRIFFPKADPCAGECAT